jgi:hypothetical protein
MTARPPPNTPNAQREMTVDPEGRRRASDDRVACHFHRVHLCRDSTYVVPGIRALKKTFYRTARRDLPRRSATKTRKHEEESIFRA